MPRFSKGTFDHDGDGKPGGSRKGDGTMAKTPRKAAARKAPAKSDQAALDAAAAKTGDTDVQSGQVGGDEPEARKAATAETFAEADKKADPNKAPSPDEVDAAVVRNQVTGL